MIKNINIGKVIIDGLTSPEHNAKSFLVKAESDNYSYTDLVPAKLDDSGLIYKQSRPAILEIELDADVKYSVVVINSNGDKSIEKTITISKSRKIDSITGINAAIYPYHIDFSATIPSSLQNKIKRIEWLYINSSNPLSEAPDDNTIPTHTTEKENDLTIIGKFISSNNSRIWARIVDYDDNYSSWYPNDVNGVYINTTAKLQASEVVDSNSKTLEDKTQKLTDTGDFSAVTSSTTQEVHLNSDALSLGHSDPDIAPFSVKKDGTLKTIKGKIASLTIEETYLQTGSTYVSATAQYWDSSNWTKHDYDLCDAPGANDYTDSGDCGWTTVNGNYITAPTDYDIDGDGNDDDVTLVDLTPATTVGTEAKTYKAITFFESDGTTRDNSLKSLNLSIKYRGVGKVGATVKVYKGTYDGSSVTYTEEYSYSLYTDDQYRTFNLPFTVDWTDIKVEISGKFTAQKGDIQYATKTYFGEIKLEKWDSFTELSDEGLHVFNGPDLQIKLGTSIFEIKGLDASFTNLTISGNISAANADFAGGLIKLKADGSSEFSGRINVKDIVGTDKYFNPENNTNGIALNGVDGQLEIVSTNSSGTSNTFILKGNNDANWAYFTAGSADGYSRGLVIGNSVDTDDDWVGIAYNTGDGGFIQLQKSNGLGVVLKVGSSDGVLSLGGISLTGSISGASGSFTGTLTAANIKSTGAFKTNDGSGTEQTGQTQTVNLWDDGNGEQVTLVFTNGVLTGCTGGDCS